jgi:hypothetical protein
MVGLAVFSESEAALCASQKLRRRLVSAPSLDLPDVSGVVSAFGAFYSDRGKRPELLLLFAYHGDELLRIVLDDLANFRWLNNCTRLFFVSVLRANENKRRLFTTLGFLRFQTRPTFRTEFHVSRLQVGSSLSTTPF